jgi:anaerobic magnesium-protoporphyrin IX monomethyl ester cyclase
MTGKHDLDLLLINPGGRTRVYQSLAKTLSAIEPPVWAALLATYARNQGLRVQILDANAEELAPQETALRVQELDPIIAAIVVYGQNPSASTQVMPAAGAICSALRDLGTSIRTMLVGGHVAALPARTLQEEAADFVCTGEGPVTIVELLQALQSGRTEDLSKVRGLAYLDGATVRTTAPAPLVTDLDHDMPGLAWDLLPMEKYRAHNWHCFGDLSRTPYASLYTTLGCPYHCSFCCIQAPFREGEKAANYRAGVNSYRYWNPQTIIAQIDILVAKYGVRNLKFADEMFVLNPRHVTDISELIRKRGYDLNIWAYTRVDTVKNEMLELLRKAGFLWLAFGVESGSERVRNAVQKGITLDGIHRTLERVKAAGIYRNVNFIFGLPEDDQESMKETLDLAQSLLPEYANFYSAMAYPGSALYNEALANELPLPKTWAGYSQLAADTLPLPTNFLTGVDVIRFRDKAFQAYYNDPDYQTMMAQTFGAEAVREIKEMLAHTLARIYSR